MFASKSLYSFNKLEKACIERRPSLQCKSPYVADAILCDSNSKTIIHTPALGCCGLSHNGSTVLISLLYDKNANENEGKGKEKKKKKRICEYRAEISIVHDDIRNHVEYIGINPKMGETLVEQALIQHCIPGLEHVKGYKREFTIGKSRFDFCGLDKDGRPFLMEVKNVPLADYVDMYEKDKKRLLEEQPTVFDNCNYNDKIAYFPDGYRKKQTDTVSPRALKHVQELEQIKKTSVTRCILCFIIQRTDIKQFQPSKIDPIYRAAVQKAWLNGVEIIALSIQWTKDGCAYVYRNDLPICLFDEYGPVPLEKTLL
jgi:DNA-binding sugar fermentation-stimulating protein